MILPTVDSVSDDFSGVFLRDRSSGLYRLSAYFLAMMTMCIPAAIALPTMFTIIVYWMGGLKPAAVNFISHWLIVMLSVFTAQVLLHQPSTSAPSTQAQIKYSSTN